jgi:hypothetical protein
LKLVPTTSPYGVLSVSILPSRLTRLYCMLDDVEAGDSRFPSSLRSIEIAFPRSLLSSIFYPLRLKKSYSIVDTLPIGLLSSIGWRSVN